VRRQLVPTRLAEGEVVMHRLTKIVPGAPEVLVLDVIEVRAGATEHAWQTRINAEWEGHSVTVVSRGGLIELKRLGLAARPCRHHPARGVRMKPAERAVLAASQARDLCLSLRRSFVGPRALARLRAGEANRLEAAELLIALGLAWAAGDLALMRAALASLPADHIAADATLSAFRDAAR
jgi:hypothetical protein